MYAYLQSQTGQEVLNYYKEQQGMFLIYSHLFYYDFNKQKIVAFSFAFSFAFFFAFSFPFSFTFIYITSSTLFFYLIGDLTQTEIQHLQQLKQGVQLLFCRLPATSHLRQPILHFIGQYLPVVTSAMWFDVSESTVKSERKISSEQLDDGLLFVERFVSNTLYV